MELPSSRRIVTAKGTVDSTTAGGLTLLAMYITAMGLKHTAKTVTHFPDKVKWFTIKNASAATVYYDDTYAEASEAAGKGCSIAAGATEAFPLLDYVGETLRFLVAANSSLIEIKFYTNGGAP
jgi:hypothetical protein